MHSPIRFTALPACLPLAYASHVLQRRAAKSLAALVVLLGFGPSLVAQQYCASGAITSVADCNNCNFKVGDPVAVTFSVVPGSVTCVPSYACIAQVRFSATVGGRYWTDQSFSGEAEINSSVVNIFGSGNLSPIPNPEPLDVNLAVSFELAAANLLAGGTLPAALPPPSAVATAVVFTFGATTEGGGAPSFSYTGQNCAGANLAPPIISTGGVVPLDSPASTIQPGSWVSIFGSNLAAAATTWNADFPTLLGGTSVTIDNQPAYLWYVSPGQINLQAPDDMARGSDSVVVTTGSGSATSSVTLGQFGPSFSLLDSKHVAGIILRSDGSGAYGGGTYDIVGPTGTSLGYKTVAAKAGDVLELFGVGFGPTSPTVPAGQAYSGAAATTNPVGLSINNAAVTPTFAGITSAGLYQINLKLPGGLGTGDVPLLATVGGAQTPSGVVLSVQ
jgi:uncharacterized protein (TIGR03437 family)